MFLSNSSLASVVMTQVKFKLNAYNGLIYSLIILQLFGILFASGAGGSGTSIMNTSISIDRTSIEAGLLLVSFLAISVGNLMTTKAYRYDDFSYVATRLSSNLANIIVLFIFSVFAGTTTYLSGYIVRILMYFFSTELVDSPRVFEDYVGTLSIILAMIFLLWMFSSVGYLAGTLFQKHKLLFFGVLIIFAMLLISKIWITTFAFIFVENGSLLIFTIKVIGVSIVLFAASTAISNRMEVRS